MKSVTSVFLFIILGLQIFTSPVNSQIVINDINETYIDYLETQIRINESSPDEFLRGLNILTLSQGLESPIGAINETFLAVLDMDGKFVIDPWKGIDRSNQPEMINDTTFLFIQNGQPVLWNFITNETEYFDFARNQHHDIQYDPISDTFMVLEDRADLILNQTGQLEEMVVDRVSQYARNGSLLFEWYLKDFANFSWYYSELSRQNFSDIPIFRGYVDPTHANSIDWDIKNNLVYLNARHFNQVFVINVETGELDSIIGENGDYKLFNANGDEVEALWYYAHDFNQVGENEFVIYNNGAANKTSSTYSSESSSLVHIVIDYDKMEIREKFSWQAPVDYFTLFWGANQLLDNGNYLGSFGSFTHGQEFINPIHTKFGGVAVEVNDEGEVVWELVTPNNWGFYRIKRITPALSVGPMENVVGIFGDEIIVSVSAYSNFPENYVVEIDARKFLDLSWSGDDFEIKFIDLEAGFHTVTIEAFDVAGNSRKQLFTIQIAGDTSISSTNRNPFPVFTILFIIPLLTIISKKIRIR